MLGLTYYAQDLALLRPPTQKVLHLDTCFQTRPQAAGLGHTQYIQSLEKWLSGHTLYDQKPTVWLDSLSTDCGQTDCGHALVFTRNMHRRWP